MEFLAGYLALLEQNSLMLFILTFVSLLFLGEPAVLGFAFFSATTNIFSFIELLTLVYISALIAESFWFFVGRVSTKSIQRSIRLATVRSDFSIFIKKIGLNKPFRLLFYSRLFSGLSILVIIFLGRSNITLRTFILYSLIVNAFWSPVIVTIGFAAGKGYPHLLTIFEDIRTFFVIILLIAFLGYYGFKIAKCRIVRSV